MAKAIREADGKALLFEYFRTQGLGKDLVAPFKCATVTADVDVSKLVEDHPWLGREVHLRGCFCYDCCTPHKCKGEELLAFGITSSNSNLIGAHTCTVKINIYEVALNVQINQQLSFSLFPVSEKIGRRV